MNRLTYGASITGDLTIEGVDGQTCWKVCEDVGNCDHCPIQTAFEHLASYEDTDLTPAEIEQLKAENARLHKLVDNIECVMRGENDEL